SFLAPASTALQSFALAGASSRQAVITAAGRDDFLSRYTKMLPRGRSIRDVRVQQNSALALCFWRHAPFDVRPADPYAAGGPFLLRYIEDKVVGPSIELAKLADGLGREMRVGVQFDPHLFREPAKSDLERGDAFGLVAHCASSLTVCFARQLDS